MQIIESGGQTRQLFHIAAADPSWHECLNTALSKMDVDYLENIYRDHAWLPGHRNIFNAFSLPVAQTNYVLFGESPYPRAASANGFAFWDAAVGSLWSETGLSKPVNRATSLRNIIKMLLITEKKLTPQDTSQPAIAAVDKQSFVQTNAEFFQNFIRHGFLLLNATPILRQDQVRKDANAWQPFTQHVLSFLFQHRPHVQLILLGNIANTIDKLIDNPKAEKLYAEHPYNISFIHNPEVMAFFAPFHLLRRA